MGLLRASGRTFFWLVLCTQFMFCHMFGISIPYSGNGYSFRFPPFRRQRTDSSTEIGDIIQKAVSIVKAEDAVMRRRLAHDIDRPVVEYDEVEPNLFMESPEDVSEVAIKCRVINWIGRLARERQITVPMPKILAHSEAKRLDATCPFEPTTCSSSALFRSVDGNCNNPRRPYLGAAFTPFRRESGPMYESDSTFIDGDVHRRDDLFRTTGVNGDPLPNPRVVSVKVHRAAGSNNPASNCSFMFTLWGQFLAHDLSDRAPGKGSDDVPIECCDQTIKTPDGVCANIDVPPGDFFRKFGRSCLSFPRSAESTDYACTGERREVLNQASSFIDGGSIYGVTLRKLRQLRAFEGGLLKVSKPNYLPISPHPNAKATAQGFAFFLAGDDRVNEFIGLIGLETVWMREHNRIARILGEYNPRWNDDKIFLETRRIIISMVQHITYKEYLPKIVAPDLLSKFDLELRDNGFYGGYDIHLDPRITNLFATVAMRFGHSMMRTNFNLVNEDFQQGRSPALNLKDLFAKPIIYIKDENSIMRGMTEDASDKCDRIITKDFVDHLFQTKTGNGFDLPAFNIQRARDHGLASYNYWRSHFGLPTARTFTTSPVHGFVDHDRETVLKFKSVYRDKTQRQSVPLQESLDQWDEVFSSECQAGPPKKRCKGERSTSSRRFIHGKPPVLIVNVSFLSESRGLDFSQLPNSVKIVNSSHPGDVDPWTGGVSELTGSRHLAVGPLFQHIIAQQFRALRKGDRFWYENNSPAGLTIEQLSEIRKVSMAKILCNHIDFVTIQPAAFAIASEPGNSRVHCDSLADIDLNQWREY